MTAGARRIVRQPAVDVMAKAMSEAQLQDAICGMLDAYKIRWWHDNDPRRNKAGLPDLVIIGRRVERAFLADATPDEVAAFKARRGYDTNFQTQWDLPRSAT